MNNPERQYASTYDFDAIDDLLAEGIIDVDDLAATAGLKMQREDLYRQSQEDIDEDLEESSFISPVTVDDDEVF
jgi:hypothetical protein